MNLKKKFQIALIALFANNLVASNFIPKLAIPKSISKISLPYAIGMAAYIALAHKDSAYEIYRDFKYAEKRIKITHPASPEVTKFVADRLIKHRLDPKGLRIDVEQTNSRFKIGVIGLKTLLMNKQIHDEILRLVITAQPTSQERERLLYYIIKIDHEVAHMKYKDDAGCERTRMLTALGLQGLIWGAVKLFKFAHYFKPSYIAQSKPFENLEACAILATLGFFQGIAYKIILDKYILFQETRADQFAFEAANAETLHIYSEHIRDAQDRILKRAAAIAVTIVDRSQTSLEYANTSLWANFRFHCYIEDLYSTYKQQTPRDLQSFQDFESWIVEQPGFAHRVRKTMYPTYPSMQETLKTIDQLLKNKVR